MTSPASPLTSLQQFQIAQCAMERAKLYAAQPGDRFKNEFQTAMVWAREASKAWSDKYSALY